MIHFVSYFFNFSHVRYKTNAFMNTNHIWYDFVFEKKSLSIKKSRHSWYPTLVNSTILYLSLAS